MSKLTQMQAEQAAPLEIAEIGNEKFDRDHPQERDRILNLPARERFGQFFVPRDAVIKELPKVE